MDKAAEYLKDNIYVNINTSCHKNKPYDIECSKNNENYFVEVKGTTTDGNDIILTYNEVELARNDENMILIIVDSINIEKNEEEYTLSNGNVRLIYPFTIEENRLKPISYYYRIN